MEWTERDEAILQFAVHRMLVFRDQPEFQNVLLPPGAPEDEFDRLLDAVRTDVVVYLEAETRLSKLPPVPGDRPMPF